MILLPFETQVILADLPKAVVLQRLANETLNASQYIKEADKRAFTLLQVKFSKPFLGSVKITGDFELTKLRNYSTAPSPTITGKVIAEGEKCKIIIRYGPNAVSLFFTLCFLIAFYAFARTVYAGWPDNLINTGTKISMLLMLVSYLFIIIPFKGEVYGLKKELAAIIQNG